MDRAVLLNAQVVQRVMILQGFDAEFEAEVVGQMGLLLPNFGSDSADGHIGRVVEAQSAVQRLNKKLLFGARSGINRGPRGGADTRLFLSPVTFDRRFAFLHLSRVDRVGDIRFAFGLKALLQLVSNGIFRFSTGSHLIENRLGVGRDG